MRYFVPMLALMLLPAVAQAATPIAGRWVVQDGTAVIAIGPCGAKLCGRVERLLVAARGAPPTDINNPDPARRAHPMVGLPILTDFADTGGDWRGQIYDPKSGRTYRSIVKKNADGTLAVKGCFGPFCRSQTWRPVR